MLYFYRPDLKSYTYKVKTISHYSIGNNLKVIVDEKDKTIQQIVSYGDYITTTDIDFSNFNSIVKSLDTEVCQSTTFCELTKEECYIIDYEGYNLEIIVSDNVITSISKNFNDDDYPDFIKLSYDVHKNIDIEWEEKNYQSQIYFLNLYLFDTNIKNLRKKIDSILELCDKIPSNLDFYKGFGYQIEEVDSSRSYPVFPYSFSITNLVSGERKAIFGISNVFDTKEDAIKKACYSAFILILNDYYKDKNSTKFLSLDNKNIINLINDFITFVENN